MSNNNNGSQSLMGLIGAVIAGIMSWTTWHSVFWCILHVLFGWLYVIYWMIYYWK